MNVVGRYEGKLPGAPAILLGSHIDTVVDAGKYDGNLGVLAAIAAVVELARRGERLGHALEVVAFGELPVVPTVGRCSTRGCEGARAQSNPANPAQR